MGNPFVHMELSTGDVAVAKKFYKKVFDWKLNQLGPEMGNYTMIDTGSRTSSRRQVDREDDARAADRVARLRRGR